MRVEFPASARVGAAEGTIVLIARVGDCTGRPVALTQATGVSVGRAEYPGRLQAKIDRVIRIGAMNKRVRFKVTPCSLSGKMRRIRLPTL